MKNIWQKYKEFVVIGLYLLLLFGLLELIIIPLNESIRSKKQYAEEQVISKEVYEKRLKETPQLKEKIDSIVSLRQKLEVFVESGNAIPLIESIESLAAETSNEISLEIIEDGSKKKDDSKKAKAGEKEDKSIKGNLPNNNYIIIRINLAGDFNTITNFIEKMENLRYFSDMISIKISKQEKEISVSVPNTSRQTNFIQSGVLSGKNENIVVENKNKFENPLDAMIDVVFYLENK